MRLSQIICYDVLFLGSHYFHTVKRLLNTFIIYIHTHFSNSVAQT